jgi:hypothetical protein
VNTFGTPSRAIAFQSHVECLIQVLDFARKNFKNKNDCKQCTTFNPEITRKIITNHLLLIIFLHVSAYLKSSRRRYIKRLERTANPVKDVRVYN